MRLIFLIYFIEVIFTQNPLFLASIPIKSYKILTSGPYYFRGIGPFYDLMKASNSAPGLQICRERLGCNLRQRRDLTHLTDGKMPDGNGPNGNPIFLAPKKKTWFLPCCFLDFTKFHQISIIFLVVVTKCYLNEKYDHGWRSEIRSLFRGHIGGTSAFRFVFKRNNQWGICCKWRLHGWPLSGPSRLPWVSRHCHWVMVSRRIF